MPRRVVLIALVILQALLLFSSATSLLEPIFIVRAPFARMAVALAAFIVPLAIGALCRTWQGAVAFAALPGCAILVGHAPVLLQMLISGGLVGFGGPFGPATDRLTTQLVGLVLPFALFAGLGWLGWLVRQAAAAELGNRAIARQP